MSFVATFSGPNSADNFSLSAGSQEEAGRRCGLHFNPGAHVPTQRVKGFAAAAMQAIINERNTMQFEHERRKEEAAATGATLDVREEQAFQDSMRCIATALTAFENGQMFAVKALHTRANIGLS